MIDLDSLQDDVFEWRSRVLKPEHLTDPVIIALKATEEAGEVAGEVVRFKEGRGSIEAVAKEIGDVAIVLAALCTAFGLNLEDVIDERWATVQERRPLERLTRDRAGD